MTILALLQYAPWLLTLAAAGWAVKCQLGQSEARGEAAIAKGAADKASGDLAGVKAERDAHRDRADRESAARKLAVDEASELRRRLEAAAVPGSVAAAFDGKFGGGK